MAGVPSPGSISLLSTRAQTYTHTLTRALFMPLTFRYHLKNTHPFMSMCCGDKSNPISPFRRALIELASTICGAWMIVLFRVYEEYLSGDDFGARASNSFNPSLCATLTYMLLLGVGTGYCNFCGAPVTAGL